VAYRGNLSRIHDSGFGDLSRSAAQFLIETLSRRGIDRGLVVDLGCGSGILASEVSTRGYQVLGVDLSEPMLTLARERAPRAEFRRASFLRASLPDCVAVVGAGECFSYLFDRGNDDRALSKLFQKVHRALAPGGVFLFDMATPARTAASIHVEARNWAVLVDGELDRKRKVLTRRITSFLREGRRFRREREIHRVRLVSSARVLLLLRDAGFRARLLRGYGSFRFPPGVAGYFGSRPVQARR
jgi:SAM-dependent methyltransferase